MRIESSANLLTVLSPEVDGIPPPGNLLARRVSQDPECRKDGIDPPDRIRVLHLPSEELGSRWCLAVLLVPTLVSSLIEYRDSPDLAKMAGVVIWVGGLNLVIQAEDFWYEPDPFIEFVRLSVQTFARMKSRDGATANTRTA